jgi:hypothetical protein
MHEVDRSAREWATFFIEMHGRGVRTLHSSNEYDSFPLLRETLRELEAGDRSCRFKHVVKLAEPSFDDTGFDAGRLSDRVDGYRDELRSEVIHDIQWMWLQDLKSEGKRQDDLDGALSSIGNAVGSLKRSGGIERFFCFPYTPRFANRLINSEFLDGFAIYRNAREHEYDYLLDPCQARAKTCLAIRPFAAGGALGEGGPGPQAQLAAVLDHPAVEGAILSTSSLAHLDDLLAP